MLIATQEICSCVTDLRESVMDRDEAVRQITQNEYPTFSIKMKPSHVSSFFLLELPTNFCNSFMPKNDEEVILVDVDGHETITKFLARGKRLSAGWRRFANDHLLLKDDVLVFHMITTAPYQFKVKIYRDRPSTAAADVLTAADVLANWVVD